MRPEGKTGRAGGDMGCSAGAGAGGGGGVGIEPSRIQALRLSETPRSMSSLSPRSSLSSLSPPCSPLVTDTSFLSGETFGCQTEPGGLSLDLELQSRLAELELSLDSQEQLQEEHGGPRGLEEKQNLKNKLGEEAKGKLDFFFYFVSSSSEKFTHTKFFTNTRSLSRITIIIGENADSVISLSQRLWDLPAGICGR